MSRRRFTVSVSEEADDFLTSAARSIGKSKSQIAKIIIDDFICRNPSGFPHRLHDPAMAINPEVLQTTEQTKYESEDNLKFQNYKMDQPSKDDLLG